MQYNRVKTESARDKKFEYNARQVVLSYGEASLFISVIGDPITGVAPIEWVKTFFGSSTHFSSLSRPHFLPRSSSLAKRIGYRANDFGAIRTRKTSLRRRMEER